jgi:hypothetical protein
MPSAQDAVNGLLLVSTEITGITGVEDSNEIAFVLQPKQKFSMGAAEIKL